LSEQLDPKPPGESSVPAPLSFSSAIGDLVRNPLGFLRLWNWKSALLSLMLRGPIFLVATARRGWEVSLAALATESLFCILTAGFYGAFVQTLRDAEPQWLTLIFLTLIVPAFFQVFEYLLHWLRGTPHLRIVELVSLTMSALSALFNWYAMRRGTLLVGGEGDRFGKDLRRLPRLLFNFLIAAPGWAASGMRRWFSKSMLGVVAERFF
jgi:hypothetical protein